MEKIKLENVKELIEEAYIEALYLADKLSIDTANIPEPIVTINKRLKGGNAQIYYKSGRIEFALYQYPSMLKNLSCHEVSHLFQPLQRHSPTFKKFAYLLSGNKTCGNATY